MLERSVTATFVARKGNSSTPAKGAPVNSFQMWTCSGVRIAVHPKQPCEFPDKARRTSSGGRDIRERNSELHLISKGRQNDFTAKDSTEFHNKTGDTAFGPATPDGETRPRLLPRIEHRLDEPRGTGP